jgi:hypothetical protein
MIRLIENLPANVIGIEAVGRVEQTDYETVLEPAVAAALATHEKLRLVYVLGEEFDGYSAGAAWADTKLGIAHWGAWERIAVVSDRGLIADAVKALGWMLPGEVRVFGVAERDDAVVWASGS